MGRWRGDDVEQVGPDGLEQGGEGVERGRAAVSRPGKVQVGDPDQLGLVDALPRVVVEPGEVAGAETGDAYRCPDTGCASGSRSGVQNGKRPVGPRSSRKAYAGPSRGNSSVTSGS